MSDNVFDLWVESIRAGEPVCLLTIVDGVGLGSKMLVRPDKSPVGTLGDTELDRVVERDALAELEVGRSGVRSYGAKGCLLYTSPSPRDATLSRMPSSA